MEGQPTNKIRQARVMFQLKTFVSVYAKGNGNKQTKTRDLDNTTFIKSQPRRDLISHSDKK